MKASWEKYIQLTSKNPPRPLLVEALQYVKNKGEALDIGPGALIDSKHLLSVGFNHVTAIDSDRASEEKAKEIGDTNLMFVHTTFEDFAYPRNTYDLVNAQYSLPFISPNNFEKVMSGISASQKGAGVLTGQLFGNRDEWNVPDSGKTFHTSDEIKKLFADMEILKMEEEEQDKKTVLGEMKHWHVFHLIVRKFG